MPKSAVIIFLAVVSHFYAPDVIGQSDTSGWKEENNIYEKVYDASLRINKVNSTTLYQIALQRPIVLALIFTRCTGVCNPFLLQLKENFQLKSGYRDFTVVVISFDPKDTWEDMDFLAKRLGLENDKQWTFAVTDNIDNLNKSIGFDPVWDSTQKQYDHDALLVGINKEGYITKKLIGLRDEHELELLFNSMNNDFAPTYRLPYKNQLFSCFNYNPKTGKNTPGLGLLFIALPAIITLFMLFSISYIVRSNKT